MPKTVRVVKSALIARELEDDFELPRKQLKAIVDEIFTLMAHHISEGSEVQIPDVGTLSAFRVDKSVYDFKKKEAMVVNIPRLKIAPTRSFKRLLEVSLPHARKTK